MLNIFTKHLVQVLNTLKDFSNTMQILLIIGIVLVFYKRYIQHTNSEKFVRGLLFLLFAWIFSEILIMFNFKILGTFFEYILALIALSLIVIFQPELRRFLGYLGQPGFFSKTFLGFNNHNNNKNENIDVVKELVESVKYFTKTKTGALIVLQNDISPSAYSDVGTKLNADVSAELILTIFHPNTPLHDGAMVIKDDKILASGVLLPLTENPQLSWKYGTRHRAAIGLTEINNSACIVVSEETGDVSIAMDGTLKKYDDLVTFKEDLEKILCINKVAKTEKTKFFNFI